MRKNSSGNLSLAGTSPSPPHSPAPSPSPQDYLIALSLQQQQQPQGALGLSDLELAQQLQQEEYQQQQGVQPVPARPPSSPQVSPLYPVLSACHSSKLPPPHRSTPAAPTQALTVVILQGFPGGPFSCLALSPGSYPLSFSPLPLPVLTHLHLESLSLCSPRADGW